VTAHTGRQRWCDRDAIVAAEGGEHP